MKKLTFALYFGNRGFFPETLIASAREDMTKAVTDAGHEYLIPDIGMTKYGAVETNEDGMKYANWLKEHDGEYDGVILSLPNFGNENGAVSALKACGVPILIQAYPDEIGHMGFEERRDAFCGKFSIMDVFYQFQVPFTLFEPHVVNPTSDIFKTHIMKFAGVCRVVAGMKNLVIGAIGARTTDFKTVRYDELTLQRYGITTETYDLSELFARVDQLNSDDTDVVAKKAFFIGYADWSKVPEDKLITISKVAVAIDQMIETYHLDAIALRCWSELEKTLGVAPCVILSELNERHIVGACELDVTNAIPMVALSLASENSATVLDWNNNYGEDPNKCILFHCGPVANSLMTGPGEIIDHKMFAKSYGAGCGFGCDVGRIAAKPMTYCSSKTENGKLELYLVEGEFNVEQIEAGFFGTGGVAKIEGLQGKLRSIGKQGYKHHVAITSDHVEEILREAFETYLNYEMTEI
ncbi:MAG: hypothetical protein PF505_02150 [Vallitaleaceae bacterium]|jgi:L-fucose isomerase-like protein|nr:hypothetical protein [Vallitaleaceae bacterium]